MKSGTYVTSEYWLSLVAWRNLQILLILPVGKDHLISETLWSRYTDITVRNYAA